MLDSDQDTAQITQATCMYEKWATLSIAKKHVRYVPGVVYVC